MDRCRLEIWGDEIQAALARHQVDGHVARGSYGADSVYYQIDLPQAMVVDWGMLIAEMTMRTGKHISAECDGARLGVWIHI